MGNRICGSGNNAYKTRPKIGEPGWNPKKDSHLLRLWAEVFRVRDNEFGWERVSDDVVPINITCLQDGNTRIFQITAYSRNSLKLFDGRIHYPGTLVYQANECFLHWKDLLHNCEWGLNFTSPMDARRFLECCNTGPIGNSTLHKKSASSSSLRGSPCRKSMREDEMSRAHSVERPPRTTSQSEGLSRHDSFHREHSLPRSECTCGHSVAGSHYQHDMYTTGSLMEYPMTTSSQVAKRQAFQQVRSRSEDERTYTNTLGSSQIMINNVRVNPGYTSNTLPPERKETSIDDVTNKQTSSQEWPPLPNRLDEPIQDISPDVPVDSQTIQRLLNVFPTVTASPAPSLNKNHQQSATKRSTIEESNIQWNVNPSYDNDTIGRGPPRRIQSTGISNDMWQDAVYAPVNKHKSLDRKYIEQNTPSIPPPTYQQVQETNSQRSATPKDSSQHSAAAHSKVANAAGQPQTSSTKRKSRSKVEVWDSDSDGESATSRDSSLSTMHTESQASVARQSGAIRKAGWLIVKNWLVHKKRKVELAPQRQWRRYWVCLKGTVLMFFKCNEQEVHQGQEKLTPRHVLVIEGCIAQPLPEHPKRENIFAISTAFGDAYQMQAADKSELDNWITAFHSACASLFARQHGKSDTVRLLKSEITKLECSIDLDSKMKKMAELQFSVVQDNRSRQTIQKQISQWEENLERLYIEQYRYKCYMCSLVGAESPNPKNLLANVSKASKLILSKIGVFNLTSFHALVCARTPLTTATLHHRSRMATKGKNGNESGQARQAAEAPPANGNAKTSEGIATTSDNNQQQHSMDQRRAYITSSNSQRTLTRDEPTNKEMHVLSKSVTDFTSTKEETAKLFNNKSNWINIKLPNNQNFKTQIAEGMTVVEILDSICAKLGLDPKNHYIRLRLADHGIDIIPDNYTVFENQEFQLAQLCEKQTYQCLLHKKQGSKHYGMTVEAELCEDLDKEDDLCVYIAEIDKESAAEEAGLAIGDEIIVVNDRLVSKLDMVYIEDLFEKSSSLNLVVRSCQTDCNTTNKVQPVVQDNPGRPICNNNLVTVQQTSQDVIVEAPPTSSTLPTSIKPHFFHRTQYDDDEILPPPPPPLPIQDIPSTANHYIQKPTPLHYGVNDPSTYRNSNSSESSQTSSHSSQSKLPPNERLKRAIQELLETEKTYVSHLKTLLEVYILPLRHGIFPHHEEMHHLAETTSQILDFQILFLQSLQDIVKMEPEMQRYVEPSQFKKVLFLLAGSFIYYADHFKLYSSFCASHSKCQKLVNPDEHSVLREFLLSRNPNQEQSSSIDSYLIKPIQRILKYPLLLQHLCALAAAGSEEQKQLMEALKGMEAVAEHINEMQKIYEEYGLIFNDLMRLFKESYPQKQQIDLGIGDLQMYGVVEWLNAADNLGKIKKNIDLYSTCFVFRTAVVLLCREKSRTKRKSSKPNLTIVASVSVVNADIIRFQTAIPVNEVEVRCGVTSEPDSMYLWELVHLRSDIDRREEKVYQLSNCSGEARNDFVKTIREIIRDSVRQMNVTSSNGSVRIRPAPPVRTTSMLSNVNQQPNRHSEHEHMVEITDNDNMKARSQTCSDLQTIVAKEVEATVNEAMSAAMAAVRAEKGESLSEYDNTSSPVVTAANSNSTLNTLNSSETNKSAKLLFASGTPLKYSSANTITVSSHVLDHASPIWKPRSRVTYDMNSTNERRGDQDKHMSASTAYSDYTALSSERLLPMHHQTLCEEADETGGMPEERTQL